MIRKRAWSRLLLGRVGGLKEPLSKRHEIQYSYAAARQRTDTCNKRANDWEMCTLPRKIKSEDRLHDATNIQKTETLVSVKVVISIQRKSEKVQIKQITSATSRTRCHTIFIGFFRSSFKKQSINKELELSKKRVYSLPQRN